MGRDITKLHPKAQEHAKKIVEECAKAGLKISITSCVRDAAEQLDCYNRKTSTLKYPNSMHNWGVAFDFCRSDGKGAYEDKDGFFKKVGEVGKKLGLIWGGDWTTPDKPHFQLSDWGTGVSKLKSLYGTPEKFMASWEEEVAPVQQKKNPYKKPTRVLFYASTIMEGDDVKYIQWAFNELGLTKLAIDGCLGKLTGDAIKAFQKRHGLVEDGKFGPRSLAKLITLIK